MIDLICDGQSEYSEVTVRIQTSPLYWEFLYSVFLFLVRTARRVLPTQPHAPSTHAIGSSTCVYTA